MASMGRTPWLRALTRLGAAAAVLGKCGEWVLVAGDGLMLFGDFEAMRFNHGPSTTTDIERYGAK
jgi:hypothetical protein